MYRKQEDMMYVPEQQEHEIRKYLKKYFGVGYYQTTISAPTISAVEYAIVTPNGDDYTPFGEWEEIEIVVLGTPIEEARINCNWCDKVNMKIIDAWLLEIDNKLKVERYTLYITLVCDWIRETFVYYHPAPKTV